MYLTQIHLGIQVPNLLISNPSLTVEFGKFSHNAHVFTASSCNNNVKAATTMVFKFVSLSLSKFILGLSIFSVFVCIWVMWVSFGFFYVGLYLLVSMGWFSFVKKLLEIFFLEFRVGLIEMQWIVWWNASMSYVF